MKGEEERFVFVSIKTCESSGGGEGEKEGKRQVCEKGGCGAGEDAELEARLAALRMSRHQG